jgi:hypothetical protein
MIRDIAPQPFNDFLRSVESARYEDFRCLPDSEVESSHAFEEMRAYLLDLYRNVSVVESFVEDDGQITDCIPEDQHPAVRRWNGVHYATPPEAPPAPELDEAAAPHQVASHTEATSILPRHLYQEQARDFPAGTLPRYRTTLQQLSRFRNLAAFSSKDSFNGVTRLAATSIPKRYATGEQDLDCLGGASYVNVWRPFVTPIYQATFSQQWYLAIKDGTLLQTVECGWHIDRARYGDSEPHLFVYATRRNYDDGHSFFNEDGGVFHCVANPYVRPGARLLVSQTDGTQVAYKMGFYRTGAGWWFYFDDHPIGCYPATWFNNGPLATCATKAKFGGEVGSSLPLWPPMGSGYKASAGHGKAAYQRGAFIHSVAGGAVNASLAEAGSTTGTCYTIDITNNSSSTWGTYLYFGGPGGQPC